MNKKTVLIYRIVLCVLSWIAILFQLFPMLSATQFGWTVSTYTFQSNFLVLFYINCTVLYSLIALKSGKDETPIFINSFVHTAVTLYITVTFVIFALVLQVMYPESLFQIGNLLYHYIVPILVIIEWVLTHKDDDELKKKHALYWLIYPYVYLAYALIVGLVTTRYIYPFIDLNKLGALVILIVAILTVFFYGLGRALIYVHQRWG